MANVSSLIMQLKRERKVSDDQIEQLRSVLARTYERRQPSLGFQFICARQDLRDGSSARIHHGRVA
jgi:hypothetical protein